MDTLHTLVANISWRDLCVAIGWEMWGLAKILARMSVALLAIAVVIVFTVLMLLLTQRLPWFVRRWL